MPHHEVDDAACGVIDQVEPDLAGFDEGCAVRAGNQIEVDAGREPATPLQISVQLTVFPGCFPSARTRQNARPTWLVGRAC
jgi:hypothetical protein